MFKIGQKVRIMRKSENSDSWFETGQGICREVLYDKGNTPKFIKYWDKTWKDVTVTEVIAIDAPQIKVVKF